MKWPRLTELGKKDWKRQRGGSVKKPKSCRLEEEIEAARLKAKEEMMRGIQVAKEMAQKTLSEQKSQYEERIGRS
ncbi:kinesin-like protein KIF14 [Carassius auratus]|uniref:Kinesin-like protein KIF14 n=1 Tax=Carassius auratus TaxID=7957 RepID=A0A6P6JA47_CARAU|nr:kinesin-like protein KIF14 [Carassius auratus]